jgi:hypothetical protein
MLELIWRKRGDLIEKEFLYYEDRGKMRIKNIKDNHHEFIDFLWKFYEFRTNGAITIKSNEKIR